MPRCKKCGKDYLNGVKDFCSKTCFESDIKERINSATKNDTSHTQEISKE